MILIIYLIQLVVHEREGDLGTHLFVSSVGGVLKKTRDKSGGFYGQYIFI